MINKYIFIDKNLLNKNKLRESWLKKNYPKDYELINDWLIDKNFENVKFSQILFNFINDLSSIPKCLQCDNNQRFLGFMEGYNQYCSKKCSSKLSYSKGVETRKINTIEKYGVEHTSQLDFVKQKQELTNLEKYGTKSPTQNNIIRNKQKSTMLSKYGVEYSGLNKQLLQKTLDSRKKDYDNLIYSIYKDLDILKIEKEGQLDIRCNLCNEIYTIMTPLLRLRYLRYKVPPCLICNPLQSYSFNSQIEIADYIKSFDLDIIKNDRTILNGKEIDILIKDLNIGFEFNGVYWHSDKFVNKSYHLDKKILAYSKGINLIHIWEDEWIYKKDIILSRIKNLIHKTQHNIYARNCEIKNIDNELCNDFLEKNHLQGKINSSIKLGLFYKNELVSCMTFGKLRIGLGTKNQEGFFELYRFCNLLDTNVIGGFSKLLKHFEKNYNPKILITYAKRDWSLKDSVYEKVGFSFEKYTEIGYWYIDKYKKRHHRFNFRKSKLDKASNLTEKEIMEEKGYNLIYDCGNIKYIKNY